MPINTTFNQQHTFHKASTDYIERGWSVIPVYGPSQPDYFKVAAAHWNPFRKYIADQDRLHHWFSYGGHRGMGIVTGKLSNLAVLDLDKASICREFIKAHPEFANTYHVKSPNGDHFYYALAADATTQTRRGEDWDWLYEGAYCVAPPTIGYSAQNDQNPKILSQQDISTIEAFLGAEKTVFTQPEPAETIHSTRDMTGYYEKHAQYGNRNTALFNTALMARDYGYSQASVIQALADLHANNHRYGENTITRHREALATIKSAFSRPPRPIQTSCTLPNLVKEALMQQGLTCVIRVLEALRQLSYEAGQGTCRIETMVALEGIVGEHSIRKTFATGLLDCIEAPENPFTKTTTSVARSTSTDTIIKCTMIGHKKSTETSLGGRPTKWYRLPTNAELAQKLGVKLSHIADPLDLDDLSSAKRTRKALHHKYIERRPGQYPSKWLAKRLGLSKITKNRYDNEIPDLHKRAEYEWKRLYWNNLNEIPEMPVPGMFLEDENAKRYPAKRALAGKLMKQKHTLKLVKQTFNTYWVGSKFDAPQPQAFRASQPITKAAKQEQNNAGGLDADKVAAYWDDVYSRPAATLKNTTKVSEVGAFYIPESQRLPVIKLDEAKTPALSEHNPRRHFDIDYIEDAANHLKDKINQMSQVGQGISIISMRRLIIRYGLKQVRRSVKRIAKRDAMENPPGLLTVMLRSESKWLAG